MSDSEFTLTSRCRICGSGLLFPVLDLGSQPLANSLVASPSAPFPSFPLETVGCAGCGVVQLSGTVDPRLLFDEYLYFSSYSDSMVAAMRHLAEQTTAQLALGADDVVMEIASNDGYLLRHYRDLGVPVLGIEPARNVAAVAQQAGIETRVAYFTSKLAYELRQAGYAPRVLHANNVLAHVPDIHDLVEGMATLLADDGVAIVETPYLLNLIDRALFETIYHEHVFYYSLGSLQHLFASHGLRIVDCEHLEVHGGSLRVTFRGGNNATPSKRVTAALESEERRLLRSEAAYSRFQLEVAEQRAEVIAQLGAIRDKGSVLAGYGAAAKATVLLNFTGIDHGTISYIVDRNPAKQGKYVPGVAIPVVSEDHMRSAPPDDLAILVWNLAGEVRNQLRWYSDAGGRIVVPLEQRRRQ